MYKPNPFSPTFLTFVSFSIIIILIVYLKLQPINTVIYPIFG